MRSKEVEDAIKNCNLLLIGDITLHIIDDDGRTAFAGIVNKQYNDDLKTVLNYISELEEENKKLTDVRKWYFENTVAKAVTPEMLHKILRQEYIPKDKIRDKIKELKHYKEIAEEMIEHRVVIADSDSLNYGRAEAHEKDIEVLKELLGE